MIFKIHSRGKGSGSGPVEYLLGRDRNRQKAFVLSGDPDRTIELIDSLDFSRKYTSGVLSFEEQDISSDEKQQIMSSLEENLLIGLDRNQYDVLWVEHQDKDRLELNFVIPNVELTSGKRLQPYYDKADRKRVECWQEITNFDYGLSDPNDPSKKRTFNYGRNIPKDKQAAIEHITTGLNTLIESGCISNRHDIVQSLESYGFNVTRKTKKSISVKLPGEIRPTRLTGAIYEQDFRAGKGVREAIEASIERYRKEREFRVQQARLTYQKACIAKQQYHRERFKRERFEVSKLVEREDKRLRENSQKYTKKKPDDLHFGAYNRNFDSDINGLSFTKIRHPKLLQRIKEHERNQQAASRDNQKIRSEIEHSTKRISGAIERLTNAVRDYAGAAIIACQFRGKQLAKRRERDRTRDFKIGR